MTDLRGFDLHVHSRFSPDSSARVRDILDRVAVAGLAGMALTDHNSTAGHARLAALRSSYPRLLLVPGVEVSTRDGHVLAYGLDAAPPPGRPALETIEWVNDRGGVPVLAHPFRWAHGVGGRLARSVRVPALEATNGHNSEYANAKAELLAAQRRLGSTGGSDAHTPLDVGRAFTLFSEEPDTLAHLLEQLRHGRTHGIGRSLSGAERFLVPLRSAGLRIGRGLRPV